MHIKIIFRSLNFLISQASHEWFPIIVTPVVEFGTDARIFSGQEPQAYRRGAYIHWYVNCGCEVPR